MSSLINSISIVLIAVSLVIVWVFVGKLQKRVALNSKAIDVTTLILQTLLKAARKETTKETEDNDSKDNK